MAVFLLIHATASCSPEGEARTDTKSEVYTRTEVVQLKSVPETFQGPGTIRAKTQTVVSSKVIGEIISLHVGEADRIRQGDLIAEIESPEASAQLRRAQAGEREAQRGVEEADSAIRATEAALRAAEANRDLALSTRKRFDLLRERRSVSPQEFDEVDARYRAAAAAVEQAQQNLAASQARRSQVLARIEQAAAEVEAARAALDHLRITSPINGIVIAKKAEAGMLATPGMPLVAIEDDGVYQLEAVIDESRASLIVPGQRVTVEIDAIAATVNGHVIEIVPAADPLTRTYTVKVVLTLPAATRRSVHSGLFGRASFSLGEKQVLLVPQSALIHRGQLTGVYIVQNDAARLRLIKTGKRYGDGIEVLSGLSPGLRIILAPGNGISDGTKIMEATP
jgi:multidrug efflux pump subunit AcrA (membrane-fusion protein)